MRRRIGAGLVVALVALGLAGCANDSLDRGAGDGASLTIGATESFPDRVVAELYGQALAADGYAVDYNTGVRGTTALIDAVKAGRIDVVPVNLGGMVQSMSPGLDQGVVDSVRSVLERLLKPQEISVLKASPAQDSVAFVVAKGAAFADLDDLRTATEPLTIASVGDFDDEAYGREALENAYGISGWTALVEATPAAVVADVRSGRAQVGVVPTTAAELYTDRLAVLADPRQLIRPGNIVPIARTAIATQEVGRVVDAISSRLVSRDLADFAARSDELPSTVAHDWLAKKHLLPSVG